MMSSNAFVLTLALVLVAISLPSSEARYRSYRRKPMTRHQLEELGPEPISTSLTRKIGEILTLAVTEAVTNLIEMEPGKLAACSTLLRSPSVRNINHISSNNAINSKRRLKDAFRRSEAESEEDDGGADVDEPAEEGSEEEDSESSDSESSSSEEEGEAPVMRRQKNKSKNKNVNNNANYINLRTAKEQEEEEDAESTAAPGRRRNRHS